MSLADILPSNLTAQVSQAASFNLNPLNMNASASGYLNTLANQYLLKPASATGLAGFVFDYEGETVVNVQSEITDHYSEQNAFFNDQVAQKPQRITLRGFVAELSITPVSGVVGALATLQGKLTELPAILGSYTPAIVPKIAQLTSQATNLVNTVDSYVSRAQNLVGLFTGSAVTQTKQQMAYQQLYALWANNTVFTLATPFNYFRSVCIESMSFTQDETTKDWSEISVTVKEVRIVGTTSPGSGLSPQLAAQNVAGRASSQIQNPVNNGKVQGTIVSDIPGTLSAAGFA
jgi:hypothetical protein